MHSVSGFVALPHLDAQSTTPCQVDAIQEAATQAELYDHWEKAALELDAQRSAKDHGQNISISLNSNGSWIRMSEQLDAQCRSTSLIRNCLLLGPFSRPMPGALGRSQVGGSFLWAKYSAKDQGVKMLDNSCRDGWGGGGKKRYLFSTHTFNAHSTWIEN